MPSLQYTVELLADRFNKTALGFGVLIGLYSIYIGEYFNAAFIFFVLVPLYFYLYNRYSGFSHEE